MSSAWKQLFLCLSSPGLISLLSSQNSVCSFANENIRKANECACGCWGGKEAEVFIFKATGVPIWKSTQLISMFLFVWFWIKRWSNSFRRLSCLYNGPTCLFHSLVLLGLKKKSPTILFIIWQQQFQKIPLVFDFIAN